MRWVLLLRAVNLGPRNKLPMKDLARVLEGLGHASVKTYLNSGNATFESNRRSATALADEVEEALRSELDLSVRAVVRSTAQVRRMVEELPDDLEGYVLVTVLFDEPPAAAVEELSRWQPERVVPGDGCLYLAYENVRDSKLTTALVEKRLGVATTSRTPATLRKLL